MKGSPTELTLVLATVKPFVRRVDVVYLAARGQVWEHVDWQDWYIRLSLGVRYKLIRFRSVQTLILLQGHGMISLGVRIDASSGPGDLLVADLAKVMNNVNPILTEFLEIVFLGVGMTF